MYFNGQFNLEDWDDSAKYAIFDDWEDWTRWFSYKQYLGAQETFTVSDKYKKKRTVTWGKPCIVLSNQMPDFKDWTWIEINCTIYDLQNKKLY